MAEIIGTPSVNTTAASSTATIDDHATTAETTELLVGVANSHSQTASVTHNAVSLTQRVEALDTTTNGRARWFSLPNPGAVTADVVVTFGGSANSRTHAINLGETGDLLDTGTLAGASGATSITLDPTAADAICLSLLHKSANTAVVLTDGTEITDIGAGIGRVSADWLIATGVTRAMDYGTLGGGDSFSHVAIAFENDAGTPAEPPILMDRAHTQPHQAIMAM